MTANCRGRRPNMGKYLVTGIGGSGKSKMCELLKDRGMKAFDGDDVPGLASWTSVATGEKISVDHTKFVDYKKVAWTWDRRVLQQLLDSEPDIFLCGSSSNEFDNFDLFDLVFVLNPDDDVHEHRLRTREDNDYGKDPDTLAWLLAEKQGFVDWAIGLGAVAIDANGSPEQTVEQIVQHIHES